MADWKQITARIRRARTSKDPAGQLSNLFQKTRDAMVAFELAKLLETSGQNSEAVKWYVTAAERFRRADWKSKAKEAIARLGAPLSLSETSPIQTEAASELTEPADGFRQRTGGGQDEFARLVLRAVVGCSFGNHDEVS